MTDKKNGAEVGALREMLLPEGSLGGIDQRVAGSHSQFGLKFAWRIENKNLWNKYFAERTNIERNDLAILRSRDIRMKKLKLRDRFFSAYSKLPGASGGECLKSDLNEVYLTHGTKPETVLKILNNGMNERFSGGIFGHGTYFAEDVAKNDQYVTADTRFDGNSPLHKRYIKIGSLTFCD